MLNALSGEALAAADYLILFFQEICAPVAGVVTIGGAVGAVDTI